MSSALTTAIYRRLAGIEILTGAGLTAQTTLAGLLGTDPDSSKPAVHFGSKNDAPPPVGADGLRLPQITFRQSAGPIDGRFADGMAVEPVLYDFEIWDYSEKATVLTDIEEQVELLLDRRRQIAPVLPLSAGKCFWSETFVTSAALYDRNLNGWFLLKRVKFVEGRF